MNEIYYDITGTMSPIKGSTVNIFAPHLNEVACQEIAKVAGLVVTRSGGITGSR